MPETPCMICGESIPTPTEEQWESMRWRRSYTWTVKQMLPKGITLAQFVPGPERGKIVEIPKWTLVEDARDEYHFTHSKCFRTKRKEFITALREKCTHENCSRFSRRCPDCYKYLW
jgi:hypothetical protein